MSDQHFVLYPSHTIFNGPSVRREVAMAALAASNAEMGDTHEVLSRHLVDLAPSAHDPAVIERDDGDDVDALTLQLLDVLNVRRQVVGLAARREGARDGDEHDLLALPLLGGVVLLRHAAGGWVVVGDRCPSGSVLSADVKMTW